MGILAWANHRDDPLAEIGDVSRFASAPKLCSWSGLTPRVRNSDTTARDESVSKMGRPVVRWVLGEAAHIAKRTEPYDDRFSRIAARRGKNVASRGVSVLGPRDRPLGDRGDPGRDPERYSIDRVNKGPFLALGDLWANAATHRTQLEGDARCSSFWSEHVGWAGSVSELCQWRTASCCPRFCPD